jgi:hypothetical protein
MAFIPPAEDDNIGRKVEDSKLDAKDNVFDESPHHENEEHFEEKSNRSSSVT